MNYLVCILGMILGIFACMALYALIMVFRSPPSGVGWQTHRAQMYGDHYPIPPPEVAQMPVHEAGIVAYQFLGVTGEEQP